MKPLKGNFAKTLSLLLRLSFLLTVLLTSIDSYSRNFYFSETIGDDSRSVTQAQNPATPWKTLNKLNSFFPSLLPGDSILFKRGEVFSGRIIIAKSGSSTSPIVLAAYGSGSKPIINGFATLTNWTNLGGGIWQSSAPNCKASLNMVTIDGSQKAIGRYPNSGYLTFEAASGTSSITDNQLTNSPNWTGAEVVIRKRHWVIDRNPITNHTNSTISYTSATTFTGLPGYGYFIQKDIKTLDSYGEWYFDPTTKNLQVFFGTEIPANHITKASTVDTLVFMNAKSFITFDNLNLQGGNVAAFYIFNSPNIKILNCDILFSGNDAIRGMSSSYSMRIENSFINHSNSIAIFMEPGCSSPIIKNCTIKNSGIIPGMGGNGNDSYQAIFTKGNNALIELNLIDSIGYIGIQPLGNYSVVNKNLVNYYCFLKDDGSGIYTWANTSGKTIKNNIVLNGKGAGVGTADGLNSAQGIYADDNSTNIEISNNTVAHTVLNGIYLHNSQYINVFNNTSFNNDAQFITVHDNIAPNSPIRNITLKNNIFCTKSDLQKLMTMTSRVNDISLFGVADSNHYIRPFGDKAIVRLFYYEGTKEFRDAMSIDGWYDNHPYEAPIEVPDYTLINLVGSNKFPNGTFNTNISGTGIGWYTGSASVSWDNTNMISGGSCKVNVTTLGPTHNQVYTETSVGSINSAKKYILKFSARGTKTNKMIGIYMRISTSPYTKITPTLYFPISTTTTNHELLIAPTLSDPNAVLSFVFSDVDCPSYIDNVEFYEANLTVTNPDDYVLFDYNATNTNKVVSLNGTYVDVDSTVYSGSVTLAPFSSIILFKTANGSANNPPTISNQTFAINENSANGTTVGTVAASDPDAGQTLTYSILSGNTNNAFAINASTGVLTVATSSALNFETSPSFALVVKVQDNGSGTLSSQATVTVNLNNVNEPPTISNQTFAINENSANGTTVGTVAAADPDAGQTLTYSILSGNTNNAFAINASTGVLTVATSSALNFETTPSFALVVKVQDNGTGTLSSQATVTVNLNNVNEPPTISNQTFAINENSANGTTVGTVAAADPDAGQTLTYSILSGNTNNAFAINASTGVLTVATSSALNFETTPSFALVVKVQDNGTGTLSSQATVTVNLNNVNEPPTLQSQVFSVQQFAPNNTIVGTLSASDPDAGQSLTFSIVSGNTSGAFALNATTGVLTVANSSALNFATNPVFNIIAKVTDNGTGSLSDQEPITVNVLQSANQPPTINNQSFSINENSVNGTIVGTVIATDPDAGQTLTYSILSGNTNNAFAINASTGVLTVATSSALNFETTPSFALIVKVQDNGTVSLSNQATITININNINEPPQINNQTLFINEHSPNGSIVGTIIANDPDSGQSLTYSIVSGNNNGAFAIISSTGMLLVANSSVLNYEQLTSIPLTVRVQDNGVGILYSQAIVTVNLNDINESPQINAQSYSLADSTSNGMNVATVVATDPDNGQDITYSIVSGNTYGTFAINPSSGTITVVNAYYLDALVTPFFYLLVNVEDNGAGNLSSQATITINVFHVNTHPIIHDQIFGLSENTVSGTAVGIVHAADLDPGQSIIWSIISGNTEGAFSIDSTNGTLSVNNAAALDFETNPLFNLIVMVEDDDNEPLSSQALVQVFLSDLNEAPVIEDQTFAIQEHAPNGYLVGTIIADDPDAGQSISYSILSGNTDGSFALISSNGMLLVANSAALEFDKNPVYNLLVKVQEIGNGNLSSQAIITVYLEETFMAPGSTTGQTSFNLDFTKNLTISDSIRQVSPGNNSIFVVPGDETNSGLSMRPFNLYPNPTQGQVFVEVNINSPENFLLLTITDLSGKIYQVSQHAYQNLLHLDLTRYPRGVYYVRIQSGSIIETHKIILK